MSESPNTVLDTEIWRENGGDFTAPSIHVLANGEIGIHVNGHVIFMDVKKWHALGRVRELLDYVLK